jgi:hypothetical protein
MVKPQNVYKIKSYRFGVSGDESARKVKRKATIWNTEVNFCSVILFSTMLGHFSHLYEHEVVREPQAEIGLRVLRNHTNVCLPS